MIEFLTDVVSKLPVVRETNPTFTGFGDRSLGCLFACPRLIEAVEKDESRSARLLELAAIVDPDDRKSGHYTTIAQVVEAKMELDALRQQHWESAKDMAALITSCATDDNPDRTCVQ